MPAASAVSIEGVWKYFGDYPALRDISLNVEGGSCLARRLFAEGARRRRLHVQTIAQVFRDSA